MFLRVWPRVLGVFQRQDPVRTRSMSSALDISTPVLHLLDILDTPTKSMSYESKYDEN